MIPAPPEPNFDHLVKMTSLRGTFEHALFDAPRPEHGFCTDDMARVMVVTTREPGDYPPVGTLTELSLRFLTEALVRDGRCRNRKDQYGNWTDEPSVEDCWGRTVWGLGTAIARSEHGGIRQGATMQFGLACAQRSPWPRAMAFAALGAAEVLGRRPDHQGARSLLVSATDSMTGLRPGAGWRWPEPRLTYANAVLPESMIAAGVALKRPELVGQGLEMLEWLLDRELREGTLSVTPSGGAGPGEGDGDCAVGPRFDQQPIEVAAMADACARASSVDGRSLWDVGLAAAVAWFLGANDRQVVMWDPVTGGGFDGLEDGGANLNQGAESTLALLSTLQHARHLTQVPVPQ